LQSLWSINNTLFSLSALAVTATIIAMVTYIIVFNINNISRGLAGGYTFCATNLVAEMKDDNNVEWAMRADAFKKAAKINRDELVIPSKWRLVQYALRRPQAAFSAVRRGFSGRPQQDSSGKRGKEKDHLSKGRRDTKFTALLKSLQFWKKEKAGVGLDP
jgi:hypothetical protein